MAGQHVLDLGRVDVEPAGDDQLLRPAADDQVSVVVDPEVAGPEPGRPAVVGGDEGLGVGRRALPVAVEDVGPADEDLVVRSASLTSTPGSGNPTVPGRRSPS